MSAILAAAANNLRTLAGLVNSSNAGATGYWREMALAAEELAGATSAANDGISGYMLRAAIALESLESTSGAEENPNYPGALKRIVDALEAGTGVVNVGSLEYRLLLATAAYTGGTPSGSAGEPVGLLLILAKAA